MDSEDDNENDSEAVIPLNEELAKCNEFFSDYLNVESDPKDTSESFASYGNGMDILDKPSTSKVTFHVQHETITCVPKNEHAEELLDLDVSVYDQTQFENEIMEQVDKAMKEQEEKKRQEEVQRELKSVNDDIKFVKKRLSHIDKALAMAPKDSNSLTSAAKREVAAIKKEQENKLKHLKKLEAKQKTLHACISGSAADLVDHVPENIDGEEDMDEETKYHLQKVFAAKETEEERLIRLGEMTPFGTSTSKQPAAKKIRRIIVPQDELTNFDKFLLSEAEAKAKHKACKSPEKKTQPPAPKKPNNIVKATETSNFQTFTDLKAVPRTKTKQKIKLGTKHAKGYSKKNCMNRALVKNYQSDSDVSDCAMDLEDSPLEGSDEEYFPEQDLSDGWEDINGKTGKKSSKKLPSKSPKKCLVESDSDEKVRPRKKLTKKVVDDGNQETYLKRIRALRKSELLKKHQRILENDHGAIDEEEEEEYTEFDEDFKIPTSIWNKLYKYQQTGVRWLWELHQQNCGGIIGDEMGLGKTIQVIAFLVGLKCSQLQTVGDSFRGLGPVLLVCPATVMHQWVREFHTWWPQFRVSILHESGSFTGKKDVLVRQINKSHGVLITSYASVVLHQTSLLDQEWHYIILDEGHKIRNPDAQATLVVKQFRTPHRIILSGSPVQNNLKELWSLFDFIFPGKLGTLPIFMQQFSVPIVQGGYANATQIQVQTAYKCATVLRDSIKPYLLRRMKSDVKMSINLPGKSEQVLFCQLTSEQAQLYKGYVNSKEVDSILNARLKIFVGLINLRKICNHPDLFDGGPKIFKHTDISTLTEEEQYGYYKRSGKMIVVEALLRLWHKQCHRVLLFTQSRQMMDILEIFVKSKGYTYMKMDGSTSISSRQPLINNFNSDQSIFVFLLTTRVGGLGVNLTGADRVIIFDPDWNPSTDSQARERAWRIGQEKQVTIYRLLTAGTIEEKIYHRQIFKQFVTNRVLKDPRQRRFFKSNDLYELFTFHEVGVQGTETSAIFAGTGSEVKIKKKQRQVNYGDMPSQEEKDSAIHPEKKNGVSFSAEKLEKMKLLAKKLSAQLVKKTSVKKENNTNNISPKTSILKDVLQGKVFTSSKNNKNSISSNSKPVIKKSKKRKAQVIDGEKIDFVVKKDIYKPPQDDTEKNKKDDDYVLSKLFKTSGVHTALKHDTIVESSNPDYMIVEGEASRVAKDAIKALKESRRMCARAEEGIPTWTGRFGGKKPRFGQKKKIPLGQAQNSNSPGKPESSETFDGSNTNDPKGGMSSSDLLSAIEKRNRVFGTDVHNESDNSGDEAGPSNPKPETEYDELLVDIRNFVAFGGTIDGQATTKQLIDTFQSKLPVHKTAVFKAMLSKICDFSRSSDGDGVWYLKGEFR